MLLLSLTRSFPFSVLTLSNLLTLGDVGTRRAASVLFVVLGRCTQRPYHTSAFDFVDFAHARHNSNEFDSALAYTQNSLTRSFHLSVFTFPFISYPLRFALPSVALGSAPLRRHRMTFGHSSKDPLRPLSQRDKVECGLLL